MGFPDLKRVCCVFAGRRKGRVGQVQAEAVGKNLKLRQEPQRLGVAFKIQQVLFQPSPRHSSKGLEDLGMLLEPILDSLLAGMSKGWIANVMDQTSCRRDGLDLVRLIRVDLVLLEQPLRDSMGQVPGDR